VDWSIASSVLADIEAHARADSPRECCGILLGTPGHIVASRRARNLSDDANRFLLDPQAHIDAVRAARQGGPDVVGFYHSHPHSSPVPSPRDLAESAYPDVLHVIVGLRDGVADIRAYTLDEHGATDVMFTPIDH
jgi:proteasome lid subunit RPN8/RPN11